MKEFSVTSGTVFQSRKLSFKKLLMAIREEVTAVKGPQLGSNCHQTQTRVAA
jgi:hypothetical protein